jgi:predicted Zn-dependent protease
MTGPYHSAAVHPIAFMIFALIVFLLPLAACSLPLSLLMPSIRDERLEAFVTREAAKILEVSGGAQAAARYQFRLVKFPREDILGLSVGSQHIFMSYELTRLAYEQRGYQWLFRHVLAHEIAHDVLGHQSQTNEASLNSVPADSSRITAPDLGLLANIYFRNYSRSFELAADRKALEYWQRLGWDCRIWIDIFKSFLDQGYIGDADHPTQARLDLAIVMCYAENP